ncbi:MAG: N-acetylmuramic acid 6-phosphate etherase [Clostridia bacterium]|nr:N-acetylmuramic acid 6-phosphate etherase [Clostridia bacterium]
MSDFSKLTTEGFNEKTSHIDKLDSLEIAKTINEEDKKVAFAVEQALPQIAKGIDAMADSLKCGGHIYYCGAGTSGRLGVLDASECLPTFGVSEETIVGLMAGGYEALYSSREFAEDDFESIVKELKLRKFNMKDVLVAISASGSANCVKGAIKYAKECGAYTICISCNPNSELVPMVDIPIIAEVGPEVINGSTRMKAGTAQKMILNMLSTGAMIRFGRVRGNYMAYMVPSNRKLVDRAIRIICAKTGCDKERAAYELAKSNNCIADAIDAIEGVN